MILSAISLPDYQEMWVAYSRYTDEQTLPGVIVSWPVMLSLLVFPCAVFLGHDQKKHRFFPLIVGLQLAALLSLGTAFPAIYGGAAGGYYRLLLIGHLTLILTTVTLAVGAYFTMVQFENDSTSQRVIAVLCMLILAGCALHGLSGS